MKFQVTKYERSAFRHVTGADCCYSVDRDFDDYEGIDWRVGEEPYRGFHEGGIGNYLPQGKSKDEY